MAAVGFDVGSENSYVSAVISGGIEVFKNEYNLRVTSSYVAFSESSRSVGHDAKINLVNNLANTIFGFKKTLGLKTTDPDVNKELENSPQEIVQLVNGEIGYKVNYLSNCVEFSDTQVMAMMLAQLKTTAEDRLKRTIRDCVITVPAYYTNAQRQAMLNAAKIADLNPLKLMNESAAVALAYGFYKHVISKDPLRVIFVDIGHSTTTVSACAFTDRKFTVLETVWDSVGGRDFDNCLVRHFSEVFKEEYNIDTFRDDEALMALMLECETLKRRMSSNSLEVFLNLERFMGVENVLGRMRRSQFEILSAPILSRIEKTIQNILTRTCLNVEDVHSVEVVGGSTRMPAIKRLVSKIFGCYPKCTLNTDEAVARGSALQCALLLSPEITTRNYVVEDLPSYNIKVTWENMQSEEEELDVFVETDQVPACKTITICMSRPFILFSHQIDRSRSRRIHLGSFRFGDFPDDIHGSFSEVHADVNLDAHGVFTVARAQLDVRRKGIAGMASPTKGECQEVRDKQLVKSSKATEKVPGNIETFELSVAADVSGLSKETLVDYIETEKQMSSKYLQEKKNDYAANALDERIHNLQSKLNQEFMDFVQDKNKNELLKFLKKQETWTYDSESKSCRTFSKKAKESGASLQPTFRRYKEWEQVPRLVEEFQEALQSAMDQIEEVATAKESCHYCKDIRRVQKIYCEAEHLRDRPIRSFPTQKKCQQVIETTEYLRKCLSEFQRDFQKCSGDSKTNIRQAHCSHYANNSETDEHIAHG